MLNHVKPNCHADCQTMLYDYRVRMLEYTRVRHGAVVLTESAAPAAVQMQCSASGAASPIAVPGCSPQLPGWLPGELLGSRQLLSGKAQDPAHFQQEPAVKSQQQPCAKLKQQSWPVPNTAAAAAEGCWQRAVQSMAVPWTVC